MTILKRGYRFLRYNDHKWLSVQCWIYSAIYRLQVLYGNTTRLRVKWGSEGEESPEEETIEHYRYAKKVAYCVNRVCSRTSWESKCLVRALTAQRLLKNKGISSTMYLGCKLEEGKMVAHAWIRFGRMYVSGGNGEDYSVVDKFRK